MLERSIEPGQTVAAAYETPELFTIAENLTHMELHVDVDEADVGLTAKGQEATFTVDAYPNRSFPASIVKVKYGSETNDGVVTYETILKVDNSDMSLRPGMTATANITVLKLEDVLLIPNAALRFEPPAMEPKPESKGGLLSMLLPHPPDRGPRPAVEENANPTIRKVWVVEKDGRIRPVPVTIGDDDGSMTQVVKGDLQPGMELAVELADQKE